MTNAFQIRRLKHLVDETVPVGNHQVKWLIEHRPSVAFAVCIGAGPWKIDRRRTVQQSFIDAIGDGDLCDSIVLKHLVAETQLEWQKIWFMRIWNGLKLNSKRILDRGLESVQRFDDLFWPGLGSKADKRIRFETLIRMPIDKAPKVVQLFARDYLFIPCFPIDRHVRRSLEEAKLPIKSKDLIQLFNQLGVDPSGYSRALFNAKAENPRFTPTRG